jgi:hypothetical protein
MKNMVKPSRPHMKNNTMPEKMRFSHRINEARIVTHSKFHTYGFSRQQWLRERAASQCYVMPRLPVLLNFTEDVTYNYELALNGQSSTLNKTTLTYNYTNSSHVI